MEITQENVQKMYNHLALVSVSKHGVEPDHIIIKEDGTILASETICSRGECETYTYDILFSDLTEDLEEMVTFRIARQKEAAAAEKIRQEKEELDRKERQKNQRLQEYLKLKKEFGE